ncbi:MAG TPA: DegT/DnrJ/EryC1/StrS family aminotransferase [Actinomycetota bacterium]|jgi:8-amino-3,8-dideoxy-alpha-D-manno-octulosonate transaminase|nr:DegT/DnrJ/EryC1/StrS family aminotransferase [Actinomycetota bacterium]
MTDRLAIDGGTPVRAKQPRLGRGLALFGAEERDAALEVLVSRSLFRYYGPKLGNRVDGFERALCELLGVSHAVGVSSGTAALRAALAAAGIGCGDEVLVPSFTFIATVNAVVTMDAVPIFCEIDSTLGIDPDDVDAKITRRTAAVVPVHLENQACAMDALLDIARRSGIAVIEDACQAIGSSYKGRALGTLGDLGAFSLQLEKNITTGEGGALVTNDDALHVRASRYSDQGGQFVTSYGVSRGEELAEPFAGENLRMTEIAGAIAAVQLRRLPGIIDAFRTNRRKVLDAVGEIAGLELRGSHDPDGDGGSSITWFAPSAEIARTFVAALRAEGIPSAQMYDGKPVYSAPAILAKRTASRKGGPWHCAEHPTSVSYEMGMCPRTEELVARSFIVGIGAAFTSADCEDVATAVAKVASHVL